MTLVQQPLRKRKKKLMKTARLRRRRGMRRNADWSHRPRWDARDGRKTRKTCD